MTRAGRLLMLALLFALSSACSAPSACETADAGPGTQLQSEGHSGSARLEAAGSALVMAFNARLSGLPELWESYSAVRAGAVLEYELRYEQAPLGGDGRTEMPRVAASLSASFNENDATSVSAPFSSKEGASAELFQCFGDSPTHCCRIGSRDCEQPLFLRFERLAGATCPPVLVSFRLRALAAVSECPLGDAGQPSLTLVEREEP